VLFPICFSIPCVDFSCCFDRLFFFSHLRHHPPTLSLCTLCHEMVFCLDCCRVVNPYVELPLQLISNFVSTNICLYVIYHPLRPLTSPNLASFQFKIYERKKKRGTQSIAHRPSDVYGSSGRPASPLTTPRKEPGAGRAPYHMPPPFGADGLSR